MPFLAIALFDADQAHASQSALSAYEVDASTCQPLFLTDVTPIGTHPVPTRQGSFGVEWSGDGLAHTRHILCGREHLPWPQGPTVVRRDRQTGRPLHVGYFDDRGREVPTGDVEFVRTAAYPVARGQG